ncbi:unknown [Clostridium sp. CAG:793]|jgi:hypothetical protein|nr:unknown [Clostridium sp. CAG:793]
MGSYYIPSNKLKGESRILYIFTAKSLIYTGVGGLIGLIFYLIFSACGLKQVGIIILVILAAIGYGIGTIKFPSTGTGKIAKNVGGDSVDEVIKNYIIFKKNRKVYTYAVPREEPDYASIPNPLDILNLTGSKDKGTKEERK